MALFTAETAREAAQKSVESRSKLKERQLNAEALAKAFAERVMNAPLSEKQVRIEKQLEKIDEMIDASTDARELNALIQSKERLLNAWSLITGHERPGVRKRSSRAAKSSGPPVPSIGPPQVVAEPVSDDSVADTGAQVV